ncbi:MAG: helix-turn-helix transcriptional regulator, partial [Rhizobiales bacterium]|nr:helix-turn-helix transcriptional regulator [Hyphomicrobiales bacterium]
RAMQIIREDVGRISQVDVVARETGLSRAHFFRLFESSIGVPPKVYLNVVRMERAVDALLTRSSNICTIASELGFTESAHFTRFFRSHAGVGPREFRNVSRLAR